MPTIKQKRYRRHKSHYLSTVPVAKLLIGVDTDGVAPLVTPL